MIVMKFGGSSIADTPSIERVTEIVRSRVELKPAVVNSAMAKTTRNLLAVAKLSAAGKVKEAKSKLEEIRQYHLEIAQKLIPNLNKKDTSSKLENYFEELLKLINDLSVLGKLTLDKQDKMLSYGELISTSIIAAVFCERGINAELLDARNFIITDDNFTHAKPIQDLTYPKINDHVKPVLEAGGLPIIQGYIGSTRQGTTTTLGFEGSDLTAMLVGAAMDASDIQIWKDVSGIMTTDPSIFPGAHTVKTISFAEAAELTSFGAKVLHPRAVEPARCKSIPIHINNSKHPDAIGTEITTYGTNCHNLIKSISYKRPVFLLNVLSNRSLPTYKFLKLVFEVLENEKATPYIVTTAETSVIFTIDALENPDRLIELLSQYGEVHINKKKAMISLIGESIRNTRDFASTVFQNLDGRVIDTVSHGASPINFTFVVNEDEVEEVIAKLHNFFFQKLDQEIFE